MEIFLFTYWENRIFLLLEDDDNYLFLERTRYLLIIYNSFCYLLRITFDKKKIFKMRINLF